MPQNRVERNERTYRDAALDAAGGMLGGAMSLPAAALAVPAVVAGGSNGDADGIGCFFLPVIPAFSEAPTTRAAYWGSFAGSTAGAGVNALKTYFGNRSYLDSATNLQRFKEIAPPTLEGWGVGALGGTTAALLCYGGYRALSRNSQDHGEGRHSRGDAELATTSSSQASLADGSGVFSQGGTDLTIPPPVLLPAYSLQRRPTVDTLPLYPGQPADDSSIAREGDDDIQPLLGGRDLSATRGSAFSR
jgi:hypothetical protein